MHWMVLQRYLFAALLVAGPASSETLPTLTLRPLDVFVVPTPIITPEAESSTPPPPPPPPLPSLPPPTPPSTSSSTFLPPSPTTARPTRRLIFSIKFPPRFRPSLPPRTSATLPPLPPSRGGPPRFHLDDLDDIASGEGRRPQFVTRNRTTTQVFLGTTASLDCVVKNVVNESVSWMRRVGDMLELLTWDTHTYASDVRYSLERQEDNRSQKWKLMIRDVQLADQGQYRCQVSTQIPMVISVTLNVTEPCARVVDERGTKVHDKHYNSGSMIELKCEIESVPFPPAAVTWRRGATLLSFNTSRGGISVKGDATSGYIRSRLYVADASPSDSGLYSCWYGNYTSDTVTVHVIAGENSAAMQHDSLPTTTIAETTSGAPPPPSLLQLYLVAAAFLLASWAASGSHLRPPRPHHLRDGSPPAEARVVGGARYSVAPAPAAREVVCVQR
ncbi:basement membrane-specific heparan sulfate proteoglycan core protein-like [Penaeus japonicus]|uniref:basement membrane-specific heparan sulfate proteoglycan core protein-like n=1 Tax=Penaeus japonicus TaxID=27405 RepID=UPI001C70E4A6|nr:basement membrane-specific heparan sulfate proteoglycan core protein-like [Penaeus japonicus]